jgi:hypothetical protein
LQRLCPDCAGAAPVARKGLQLRAEASKLALLPAELSTGCAGRVAGHQFRSVAGSCGNVMHESLFLAVCIRRFASPGLRPAVVSISRLPHDCRTSAKSGCGGVALYYSATADYRRKSGASVPHFLTAAKQSWP